MLAQPGHALELEHVRELVCTDPAAEGVGVHIELAHRAGEVGSDEEEAGVGVGAEQRDVVLPKHPRGQVSHDEAGLGGDGG